MKKVFLVFAVIVAILIVYMFVNSSPPTLMLKADGKQRQAEQSSYCWGNKCVDMIHPIDQLQDKQSFVVKAGSEVALKMGHKPNKAEKYLSHFKSLGVVEEYPLNGNTFIAPTEPGIYYFAISYNWMSDKEEFVSEGSSSYTFKLEVK